MSEPVTEEKCRAMQGECSRALYVKLDALQASQHRTELAVTRISEHLGLNGAPAAFPHHRETDETERLHQRAIEATAAATIAADAAAKAAAAVTANKANPNAMPALPWRAWGALAALFLLVVGLALIAGREGLAIWPKAPVSSSLVVPK